MCGLLCCAKHNQHEKLAIARGSGGMPPRKFLKISCSETDLIGNFQENLHLQTYK